MDIKTEYNKITRNISKQYYEKLKLLQENCPHKDLYGKYKSDTGNWCSQDDRYWLELKCNDCNKMWDVDSSEEEYGTTKFKEK